MHSLSIVIPAYNEHDRLEKTLASIAAARPALGADLLEVIVADDGSTDDTAGIAMAWNGRLPMIVVRLPLNRGKGAAVRTGMLRAAGDAVLMYDADGATPITEVPALLAALSAGADVAIGSRVLDQGEALSSMKPHRRLIGRVYRVLCGRLIPGIKDAACGFKLFTSAAAKKLFSEQRIDRFAFDVEVLALALRHGMNVAEIPVKWTAVAESKVRLLRDGTEMFFCLLRLYITHPAPKNSTIRQGTC